MLSSKFRKINLRMSLKESNTQYRFLFAGGGTGGHLFPAIAVADEIKRLKPESEILFVGNKNKIEGSVVPKLGYKFSSIWIKGFYRKFNLSNFLFPVRLIVSMIQSVFISMKFKPRVAIGSGGYVAGPAIWGASVMGAKIILMESNSYPGITTRLLERFSDELHITFDESRKYLRKGFNAKLTGNPVRTSLNLINKSDALKKFELSDEHKTIFILGGSLGAGAINKWMFENIKKLEEKNIQIIWQTGKNYFEQYKKLNSNSVKVYDFIDDMNFAYSACDLLIARSGATTIAEILNLGIPAILIPSPNVSENHQFYNAKSLADNNSAILLEDKDLNIGLFDAVLELINNEKRLNELSDNAKKNSKPNAANVIAASAIKFADSI